MVRLRAVVGLIAALGAIALLGAAQPAAAVPDTQPTVRLLGGREPSSATAGCPGQVAPPPPVDRSEVPAPGALAPEPMAIPERSVGGPRMGECGLVLPAGAPAPPEGISSTSWLVADADSGEVLAAREPHARHRPASTMKVFTALLAADRLPADQVVVATQADADQEGSRVGLGPGGSYTVRQLLTGLLLASGNDAAHALARQLGGITQTVDQMNELAAKLGALDTRAATPSGLDGPGMSTSTYDLALAFRQVLNRPLLVELLGTRQVSFPGFADRPAFVLGNDNKLLVNYRGALGGKSGFTDDARHTLIDAAQRGGRRLIVVLMHGEQRPVSMSEQAARLLDYGFALTPGRPVGQLVDKAPPPEIAPAAPEAIHEPPDGVSAAAHSGPHGLTGLVPLALWISLPVLVLAVLGALVARQRHR